MLRSRSPDATLRLASATKRISMMTPRMMIEFMTAEPFRPFRIRTASGRTFDIGHPEMIKGGPSRIAVYTESEEAGPRAERWQEVSLMLLESVEPLDVKSTTESH